MVNQPPLLELEINDNVNYVNPEGVAGSSDLSQHVGTPVWPIESGGDVFYLSWRLEKVIIPVG